MKLSYIGTSRCSNVRFKKKSQSELGYSSLQSYKISCQLCQNKVTVGCDHPYSNKNMAVR